MAGTKSSRGKSDPVKKRKRDVVESDSRSKRLRAERKANGQRSDVEQLLGVKSAQTKLAGASVASETTGSRQLEVVRQFDNTEAGWRVSKPMGGRMLDIDPILTEDDQ